MDTTPDEKHQRLIEAIKDNNHILNLRLKIRKSTGSGDWANLDINEINDTVGLIVTYLNLTGGSIGEFNLYELLQSYFGDKQARKEINECVERSLARFRSKHL